MPHSIDLVVCCGHLGCFHLLIFGNNVSTRGQLSWTSVFMSLSKVCMSGNVRSCNNWRLTGLRTRQQVLVNRSFYVPIRSPVSSHIANAGYNVSYYYHDSVRSNSEIKC